MGLLEMIKREVSLCAGKARQGKERKGDAMIPPSQSLI